VGEPSQYSVRAVHRVADVLDELGRSSSGSSLAAVSVAVGMPKSTTFRYLTTLCERGYASYDEDAQTYRLGTVILGLRRDLDAELIEAARPVLEALRDEMGETTNLGVLDGTAVVHLVVCESSQRMRLAARVGERAHLHTTALGKVVLAQLDDDRVVAVSVASGLPALTSSSETTLAAVCAEVARTRTRGYAVDDSENQEEGRCVAVPVVWPDRRVGISVSAPAARLPISRVPEIARRLTEVAATIAAQATAVRT
jgi:IclR family acetate operon transcriptional repressor